MAQYQTFSEWLEAEPEALEPLYQWLDELLQEVIDDRTKRSGLQDKVDVLKENE